MLGRCLAMFLARDSGSVSSWSRIFPATENTQEHGGHQWPDEPSSYEEGAPPRCLLVKVQNLHQGQNEVRTRRTGNQQVGHLREVRVDAISEDDLVDIDVVVNLAGIQNDPLKTTFPGQVYNIEYEFPSLAVHVRRISCLWLEVFLSSGGNFCNYSARSTLQKIYPTR